MKSIFQSKKTNFIDKLNTFIILNFLNQLDQNSYCLIKKSIDFPNLKIESDLDIVVKDETIFEENLHSYFDSFENINILKIKENDINSQFDLYIDNKFYLKFDIYFEKFESKNTKLKKNFFDQIFDNPEKLKINLNNNFIVIVTPAIEFELLIRLLEYLKYPTKTHHKYFINQNINRLKNPKQFFGEYIDVDLDNNLNRNKQILITELFIKKVLQKIIKMIKKNTFIRKFALKKFNIKFINKKIIDIGWTKIVTKSFITLPIENLYVNLKNKDGLKKLPIQDSPHFLFLGNQKGIEKYKKYLIENFDEINNENIDFNVKKFQKLHEDLSANCNEVAIVIDLDKELLLNKKGTVIDGVHRLSILKHLGKKQVLCYIKES